MGFKKVRYNTGENIVEIKIRDENRKYIENWTIVMSDLYKWVETMRIKYGLEKKNKVSDLDWAI